MSWLVLESTNANRKKTYLLPNQYLAVDMEQWAFPILEFLCVAAG